MTIKKTSPPRKTSDKLLQKVKSLESRALDIRRLASKISEYENTDENLNRLILLNEGIGIPRRVTTKLYNEESLEFSDNYKIILAFKKAGDLLATQIYHRLQLIAQGRLNDLVLENSRIPEKLVLRTMTEKEYDDYLGSREPIGSTEENTYFLDRQMTTFGYMESLRKKRERSK